MYKFSDKLRDILSPNRMASSGGADDVIGLSRETGISQGSINNVYDDLNPSGITCCCLAPSNWR
ncbi:MAG: hypothetical protein AAFY16_03025 [Cyanobacteria bacterium J06642_3]